MVKSYQWGGWVGLCWLDGLKIIESAPVPFWPLLGQLGLELGWTGLGLGLGGLGTQGLRTRV